MLRTRSAFSGCWSSTSRKPGSRPESKTPRPASWASMPSCQNTASLSPGPCGDDAAAGGEESEAIGGGFFRWRPLFSSTPQSDSGSSRVALFESEKHAVGPCMGQTGDRWAQSLSEGALWAFGRVFLLCIFLYFSFFFPDDTKYRHTTALSSQCCSCNAACSTLLGGSKKVSAVGRRHVHCL
jgi:hypothetical protein